MKTSLLGLLRSPVDGTPLRLEAMHREKDEVLAGSLVDRSLNAFPIVQGVPRFAEAIGEDATFAFKWKLIGDSYGYEEKTRAFRQQWYLDRFGFRTRRRLVEFLQAKPFVLDAGTGTGVDAAMFAESGSTVVAFDLSLQAADATYRHLGHLPNVHIVQADVRRPPFPPAFFDYVSCDQVLHHTPETAASFSALANHVKPQGHLALYVYRKKGPIREFTDDYLRERTTHMSPEDCYEFCKAVTLLGKALSDLKATVDVPVDVPLLGIKAGREDVQRFIYWNVLKCFWNEDYDLTTNIVVNFDWYHPKHANRHTVEEVRSWFAGGGFEVELLQVAPSGISALGKRVRGP